LRLLKRGGGEPLGVVQMLWTEEAVEVLKELALEGRSASVIAAALGSASRSAVIGKANRIGIKLNGGRGGGGARRNAGGYASSAISGYGPPPVGSRRAKLRPALTVVPERQAAWFFAEAEVGEMRRVGFEEIREFVCRWPLGDPMSGDFAYCGLKSASGRSYCAGHCRMAYQPPTARPRRAWREWRRSFALADRQPLSSS
jgi:GcrA cell cycle regulator